MSHYDWFKVSKLSTTFWQVLYAALSCSLSIVYRTAPRTCQL